MRLEEPRPDAKGLGRIAVDVGPSRKIRERVSQLITVGRVAVEGDVALREHFRVAGGVDGRDVRALTLELLGDAGRPGEQVEGPPCSRVRADGTQDRHQPSFRSQILDQER